MDVAFILDKYFKGKENVSAAKVRKIEQKTKEICIYFVGSLVRANSEFSPGKLGV